MEADALPVECDIALRTQRPARRIQQLGGKCMNRLQQLRVTTVRCAPLREQRDSGDGKGLSTEEFLVARAM